METDPSHVAPGLDGDVEFVDEEMLANGDPLSAVNGPAGKQVRIIRKAKRPSKTSPHKDESGSDGSEGDVPKLELQFSKNSRKSRDNRGRGLPKKGGGGGKGTWGKPGEVIEEEKTLDPNDPNYDSESDSQEAVIIKPVAPNITDEELSKEVEPIIQEYFTNGDVEEALGSLTELNINVHQRFKIAELAVSLAMEKKNSERELTSRLISDLYGHILSREGVEKSFDILLNDLSDLTLDTPEAPQLLGQFIARAVADDCLPPKFVSSFKGKVDCPHARSALDKANVLLNMKHGIVRLDSVWGDCGNIRPVKYLTKKMNLLLKEYLSSGDVTEAIRCVGNLEVPHFHHELIYQTAIIVIEDTGKRACEEMTKLVKALYTANIITFDQMIQGFDRVFEEMTELCLDVPAAYNYLEDFGNSLHKEGVLPEKIYKELPSKGRKRFVSEGDGGRVKDPNY